MSSRAVPRGRPTAAEGSAFAHVGEVAQPRRPEMPTAAPAPEIAQPRRPATPTAPVPEISQPRRSETPTVLAPEIAQPHRSETSTASAPEIATTASQESKGCPWLMGSLMVLFTVVPVAIAGWSLYRWQQPSSTTQAVGPQAALSLARDDGFQDPGSGDPDDDPSSGSTSPTAASAQCPEDFDLSGEWLMTTTIVGSSRRVGRVHGWYRLVFKRDRCEPWATIEKTGYGKKTFSTEEVQRGRARIDAAGAWGTHPIREVSATLQRADGSRAIRRVLRFTRIDEQTLAGEWRQDGESWDKHGMWGYFTANRGAASHPEGGDRTSLPCPLTCRMGCEATRREADGLEPHQQLQLCTDTCASSHDEEYCPTNSDFSMTAEAIGALRLGMSTTEILTVLGAPTSKSRPSYEYATGLVIQSWNYPSEGLSLDISLDRASPVRTRFPRGRAPVAKGTLESIAVQTPSTRTTSKGIQIGTEAGAAVRAYGKHLSREFGSPDRLVVGSVFGGLLLDIKDGRVSHMFLGAAAE